MKPQECNDERPDVLPERPLGRVDVLLCTCNSAAYLEATLASVAKQDYTQWRLLIRDGESSDSTLHLLPKWLCDWSGKMVQIASVGPSGPLHNFSTLLSVGTSDYMMFCDHDDVWMPDKISRSLAVMHRQEELHGQATPLLVFTDMEVVDSGLRCLHPSYFRYTHIDPTRTQFHRLLVQNVPSGCTMLFNRALADLCQPIPSEAVMHDHWIALVAAAFGQIAYLDEPTLLYRQHAENYYGASAYGADYLVDRVRRGAKVARARFCRNVRQARAFLDRYGDRLPASDRRLLEAFAALPDRSWPARRWILLKYGLWKTGLARNLGMFLTI